MFLLIDSDGYVRYIATTNVDGNPDTIHTRLESDSSEESVRGFFDIMPSIEDYSLADIENEPVSIQNRILEDMKNSEFDINIKNYNLESEVVF